MDSLAEAMKKHRESARIENLKRLPKWLPESVRINLSERGHTLWAFENETRAQLSKYQKSSETEKRLCTDRDNMELFWNLVDKTAPHKAAQIIVEIGRIESDWNNADKTLESHKKEDIKAIKNTLQKSNKLLKGAEHYQDSLDQLYLHFMERCLTKGIDERAEYNKKFRSQNSWPEGAFEFYNTAEHLSEKLNHNALMCVLLSSIPSFAEIIAFMEKEVSEDAKLKVNKRRVQDDHAKRRFFIKELQSRIIYGYFSFEKQATKNKLLLHLARVVLDDVEIEKKTISDAVKAK